jgi:hypothetical protein
MDVEDYEGAGPSRPPNRPVGGPLAAEWIAATLKEIAATGEEAAAAPDGISLVLDVPGLPKRVAAKMSKRQTDWAIKCLIAARNEVWPTP